MKTGLVSVTFRQLNPFQIIRLVREAGLDGIEWGADVHVPPGAGRPVGEIRRAMEAEGLVTLSYGSYHRLGSGQMEAFRPVVDCACLLGAPNIRVWAGTTGSRDTDASQRRRIVEEALRCAELADAYGMDLSLEYHGNTLTDALPSALALLDEVSHPRLRLYWQPLHPLEEEAVHLAELEALRGTNRLTCLHVYHWRNGERLMLRDGWVQWLERIRRVRTAAQAALLEFVADDRPERFLEDARTLRELLAEADKTDGGEAAHAGISTRCL